ncbi:MAG: radical SAM protein [Candidatus Micrarchaeota archaeon]
MVGNKIVLIQPEIKAGSSLGVRKTPASIQHLGGQLQSEGFNVFLKHEPVTEGLVRSIIDTGTNAVGISTMTSNFREGEKLAFMLKQADPLLTIIIGGWHPSGCARSYLSGQESESINEVLSPNTPFDLMVFGEGELVLPEILRCLSNGRSIDFPGVGIFKDGRIKITGPVTVQLDSVADPIWGSLDINSYRDLRSGALDLSIHTQRGCPWGCGYCSTPIVSGKALRSLSIEKVIAQLIEVAEKFKPQVITFTNEDPLLNLSYFRELVARLNMINFSQRYGVSIDIFASIVDIHRLMSEPKYQGMVDEIKNAGISSFTIGIESFNPKILRKYGKLAMITATMTREERSRFKSLDEKTQDAMLVKHYFDRVRAAITFSQQHGILCVGDYMIGNPGETTEEVLRGFSMFSAIKGLHVAYIPQFTPFPGTQIWSECYPDVKRIDGKIAWELFDASHSVYSSGMPENLREMLEVEFYTSERYLSDMHIAINAGFLPSQFFKNRFDFMQRTFGNSEKLDAILRSLQS